MTTDDSVPRPASELPPSAEAGLFRTALVGPGHTLQDAFESLERAPLVERLTRHPHRHIVGGRIALSAEEGEGYWDFTRIRDELYVIVQDYAYKDPRVERMGGDGTIQFNFRLSGDLSLGVTRQEPLRLIRPALFLWTQPPGMMVNEWTAPKAHERAVSISVTSEFLADQILGSSVNAPEALRSFIEAQGRALSFLQVPLSARMFELATNLVQNPHTGPVSLVYVEALALELLCEAVRGFQSVSDAPDERYDERDLRCLHAARALLMKQLSPPPTMRQVARTAGMSETTLKRGFKAVFGETLFDFSLRCRMQHALMLLREQRLPVARVAEEVGYQYPTSFTTAFQHYFGMRPKDVRPLKTGNASKNALDRGLRVQESRSAR
jgi:AraC-like DNA-binding protein